MSQIEELHNRIAAAMERISSGIDALSRQATTAAGDDPALRYALDEEKLANAQLQERLKALKDRHATEIDALRAEAGNQDEVRSLKAELEELRRQVEDDSEVNDLKAQLAEARAKLESSGETTRLKEEIAALKAELSDSERVGELSAELEMLRAERASHGSAMSRLENELRQLQKANEQLRDTIAELRAAAEAGVANPELLNRATEAELEALRAARATDAAEAHAVLARLEPLLARANLAEGEVE